jgi:hypothetical protein
MYVTLENGEVRNSETLDLLGYYFKSGKLTYFISLN